MRKPLGASRAGGIWSGALPSGPVRDKLASGHDFSPVGPMHPRSPGPLLTIVLALLLGGAGLARADQDPKDLERRQQVLVAGGHEAEQAANDLFVLGDPDNDLFLLRTLRDGNPDHQAARVAILKALRMCGRHRPEAACAMAYEALADPVKAVSDQAREVFGTFEDDLNRTFDFIRARLTETKRARPDTQKARQALALVEVLERHMRNQIAATGILVELLEGFPGSELEARVRQALQRMTSCSFQDVRAWRRWYDETRARCGGSLALWRAEIDARQAQTLARYEDEALEIFRRLLDRLASTADPEAAILQELADTLKRESVPKVRYLAIQRLGDLAAKKNLAAVALLRGRLQAGGDDAPQAVLELARAEDPALLPDILPWIGERHPIPMRLAAIGALSRLKAPGAVDPLIELLGPRTIDEVREAAVAALGKIGQNPEGRVSRTLVALASGILGTNPAQNGAATLVKLVAEALSLLPLPPPGPDTQETVTFLERLAGEVEDANVRYYAVTALGKQDPEDAFLFLLKRSEPNQETAVRVKRAILDALTQQAVDHPDRREKAVRRLVAFVEDPEPLLVDKSRSCIASLVDAKIDPTLAVRRLLAHELSTAKKVGWEALATRYLESLPTDDKVRDMPAPQREVYGELLEVRARGRLQSGERPSALTDLRALFALAGPTGFARLQTVFELGLSCLPAAAPEGAPVDPLALTAWTLVLDAAEALKADPARAPKVLEALQAVQQSVPAPLQQRLKTLRDGSS